MANLLYESAWEHFYSLVIDLIIFFIKSIYFIAESIFLTFLPSKLRKLKDVAGQTVLITGGGGGVGRHLALNFARLKSRVVIWDVNAEAIKGTVEALLAEGYTCHSYEVDIANKERVYEAAKRVRDEVGKVDILINNAGIVTCRTLLELPDKAIENTYNVNILSHYWMAKAFLPDMIAQNKGHIVTVSSVTGLLGTYACTDYAATKFACVGFHESLFTELKTHGHDNVNLTLVCPYHIATNMFQGVRPRLIPCLEPKYVADSIVKAVQRNEVTCILPDSVRLVVPFKNILPAKMCWEMMHRVMKTPESMMLFKTRGRAVAG